MQIQDFLHRLKKVTKSKGGWTANCPSHDDKKPSLSIALGEEDRILVTCFAGCAPEAIAKALGFEMRDLMPEHGEKRREIAYYDYRDEDGKMLYQKVRYEPKDFRIRRPENGDWIWNIDGVRRVLYRLPELIATPKDQVVYIVEGEKDADRLVRLGLPVTTNGAAGTWLEVYSPFFEGRKVAILPDNDPPGRLHAENIKKNLVKFHADHVEIVHLPGLGPKGDVSQWLLGDGNTKERLEQIVEETFRIEIAERSAMAEDAAIASSEESGKLYWDPYDLVRSKTIKPPVGYIHGHVFPKRTVSLIMGPSSSGKSYFVMYLGQLIAAGDEKLNGLEITPGRVLFLSLEMEGPELMQRSMSVWAPSAHEKLRKRFLFRWKFTEKGDYMDFGGQIDCASVDTFERVCKEAGTPDPPDIVFLDSLSRLHHMDENSNQQMGIVMANLELAAKRANVAMVVIHHAGKPNEFRTGIHKGRGASCIPAQANDVLMVEPEPMPDGLPRSVVSFDKTRSVPLSDKAPLQPFIFTQDLDGRSVPLTDGKTLQGLVFTAAKYEKKITSGEHDAKLIRDTVKNLCALADDPRHTEDGEVFKADLVDALKDSVKWSSSRADRAISMAVNMGYILRGRIGKAAVYFLPIN